MNTLSAIANDILLDVLNNRTLSSPPSFESLVSEMLDIPEKPKDYVLRFQEKPKDRIVLVTGGLDSSFGWFITPEPKRAVYFDIGQKYRDKELNALRQMQIPFEYYRLADISNIDVGDWKHIHPGRNFLYISKAAELLKSSGEIIVCSTLGEMPISGGDKSHRFFEMAEGLINQYTPYPIKIILATSNYTKPDEVKYWYDNFDKSLLPNVVSCFSDGLSLCGSCQSCLRRYLAFAYNNLDMSYQYKVHPMIGGSEFVQKYKTLMTLALQNCDFQKYHKTRCIQDLEAIRIAEDWLR